MNRDMDLVRTLLIKIADDPKYNGRSNEILYPDQLVSDDLTYDEIDYHIRLLIDAGLLDAESLASPGFVVRKVSWEGHEFLDDTRDPEIWDKTKQRAKAVGGVGISFLWEIAKAEIKTKLGLP
jgi:hypothetical protein